MNDINGDTLRNVFIDIAENMVFMFVETPEETPMPVRDSVYIQTYLGFTGAFQGALAMTVPESVCAGMAANILGIDPSEEQAKRLQYDALKEFLNVLCGNLLSAIAGEEASFKLMIPDVKKLDRNGWEAFRQAPGAIPFLMDDSPALLRFVRQDQ